jgi:hypothetical protein
MYASKSGLMADGWFRLPFSMPHAAQNSALDPAGFHSSWMSSVFGGAAASSSRAARRAALASSSEIVLNGACPSMAGCLGSYLLSAQKTRAQLTK